MADDKRTKIGQTGPVRPMGGTPAPGIPTQHVAPNATPAPVDSRGAPTSILPDHGAHAHAQMQAAQAAVHAQIQTSYLPPTQDPLLGQTLAGRYHIIKKLGEGGMGAVYLATHLLLEKQVALKVLHGEFARKQDLVERFMQEAKAASRIRHENVIDISDFGITPEGLVFFAMEMLKGHDLHEEVARARLAGQLLPWARTKKIFLQICGALAAAHGHGIIHRDLKPENVYLVEFLGEPDFVKLLDFGIAKLTEVEDGGRKLTKTGMLFGTPEYMSPEQARGEGVDSRVDVYAMGCILFQLVTGRVPFEADNFMGVLSLHLTEPPPQIPMEVFDRIGAPRDLAWIIDRALMKERDQRWSTIGEMADAIRRACGDPIPSMSTAMASVNAPQTGVHAGVQAPATTTQSRQPTPAPITGEVRQTGQNQNRVKTQWTGNLQVPQEEDRPRQKSKLPLVLAVLVVLGGGGAAAYFATRGGGGGGGETPGSGTGPASGVVPPPATIDAGIAQAAPVDAALAPPPPAVDAAVALAPVPDTVTYKLDSKPQGADITNVATGKKYGRTPLTLKIKGSHDTLTFNLHLNGYGDALVDVTPEKDGNQVVALEKGANGPPTRPGQGKTPPGPGSSGTPVTTPGGGSDTIKQTTPPGGGDDDCPELPCAPKKVIKGLNDGSKPGAGSGSGS